ncbi:MAG: pyridinium-3,5-biscarboxylic acid mononucleotide synthase [Actinomycetota bacterium]|jgi:NCAIR mutase (PurE)-related protein|nr:pyridinium-3,5-biscarboxylic acid mononucleotide synthase [Actinomycetota bacterium]
MRPDEVEDLLSDMLAGTRTADEVLAELAKLPTDDIGFANLDLHRELRQGFPEAIYGEGKDPDQLIAIAARLLEKTTGPVLATRVTEEGARALWTEFPGAEYSKLARLVTLRRAERRAALGTVAVVTAGTSDLPIAEEAAATSDAMGISVDRIVDVGVAGVHRLLAAQDRLRSADIVIVVAGMEGALASLVGGLVAAPVVAVPTSVGYGASFDGLAALLAMLNSCSAGLTVTNIDNGFGAAMAAVRILQTRSR